MTVRWTYRAQVEKYARLDKIRTVNLRIGVVMKGFVKKAALTAVTAVAMAVMLWPGTACGQDARLGFAQRQRQIEQQLQFDAGTGETKEQLVSFEWGGWFTSSYELFHDNGVITGGVITQGVHERHLGQYDLRVWGRANIGSYGQVYARMRLGYVDWEVGDSLTSQDHYWDGPNLDRGYVSFDLRRAIEEWQGHRQSWTINTQIGRQYVEWGTGLVLSLPVDAVVVGGQFGDLNVRGLAARSINSIDNIDRSAAVSGRLEREFYGAEIELQGFQKHRPFAYALRAIDRTDTPTGSAQLYGYDAWYFGVGSRGILWNPNWTYAGEVVWEHGRGYADVLTGPGPNALEDIEAFAADVQINHYLGGVHKPRFSAQYTFASGDDDRTRPSDTASGNVWGSNDYGFNAFGFRYTGYSFAPVVTNIHVLRFGFAFLPFPESEAFDNLEIGADVFGYAGAQTGGVSDISAGTGSRSLGYEADTHIYWRIVSDLSLVVRYGVFMPGEAFLDGTSRHSLYTGVTLSF